MDHADLVKRAAAGDVKAFVELTRRFQQFAFGSALTHVRDFQRAEDVTQEALIAAWTALPTLTEPVAFAGWLRGIVRHHSSRSLRRKRVHVVPLAEAEELSDDAPPPDHVLERRRQAAAALAAIADLPKTLREPATLFFIHDCSHQDIATFLGLPSATVNNRIHAARTHLKQRILTMTEALHAHALPDDFANRVGRLIEARGQVVEALFDPAAMPDLMSELTVSDEIRKRGVPVQVFQRLADGKVRGVAASPVAHVPRGATVLSSRRRATTPIDRALLEHLLAQHAAKATNEIIETGIKVIDVMCPIPSCGSVAIAGGYGAGLTVMMAELVRRISKGHHPLTIFVLFPPPSEIWPPSLDENFSIADTLRKENGDEGTAGSVQTFFLGGELAWTAEKSCQSRPGRYGHPPLPRVGPAQELSPRRRAHDAVAVAKGQSHRGCRRRSRTSHSRADYGPPRRRNRPCFGTRAGLVGTSQETAGVFLAAVLRRRAVHQAPRLVRQPCKRASHLPRNPRRDARRPDCGRLLFYGRY